MSDKIEYIGNHLNNALRMTPKQCLQDCIDNDIGKRGAFKNGKKIIIICLDDTDKEEYDFSFCQAGMKFSEILSLLTIFKKYVINSMGF